MDGTVDGIAGSGNDMVELDGIAQGLYVAAATGRSGDGRIGPWQLVGTVQVGTDVRGRTSTNFDGVLPWREKCRNVSALWSNLASVRRRRKLWAGFAVDQDPHGSPG